MNKKEMVQLSLMTEVASMYYEKDMTQEEIGNQLYLSRARISRILKKAHEMGVVEFRINHIPVSYTQLDVYKRQMYGGSGSIVGTLIGVAIMETLTVAMTMLRVDAYWQKVVVGAIIIIAVGIDTYRRSKAASDKG